MRKVTKKHNSNQTEAGFTLVEVMLTLGIAGLMLVGIITSTYSSIGRQRYNDSVRGFAEYLRSVYNEVISPESFAGHGNVGSSQDYAILGKMLVFGYDYDNADDRRTVYSATIVGSTDVSRPSGQSFIEEFTDPLTEASIFCGEGEAEDDSKTSVDNYLPLWEAELVQANDVPNGAKYPDQFRGTIIIARTPTSGTIHTIYSSDKVYDLKNNCQGANTQFQDDLRTERGSDYEIGEAIGICVKSDNSRLTREVRIAADGRNASAIWTRNTDDGDNACETE